MCFLSLFSQCTVSLAEMSIIGLSLITGSMEKSFPSSTLQISKFFNTNIMPFLSSLSSRLNISYSTNCFLFHMTLQPFSTSFSLLSTLSQIPFIHQPPATLRNCSFLSLFALILPLSHLENIFYERKRIFSIFGFKVESKM